jgi:hypothetical protein
MTITANLDITTAREYAIEGVLEDLPVQRHPHSIRVIRDAEQPEMAYVLTETQLYVIQSYARGRSATVTVSYFIPTVGEPTYYRISF